MTSTQNTIIEEVGSSVMVEPDQVVESVGAVDESTSNEQSANIESKLTPVYFSVPVITPPPPFPTRPSDPRKLEQLWNASESGLVTDERGSIVPLKRTNAWSGSSGQGFRRAVKPDTNKAIGPFVNDGFSEYTPSIQRHVSNYTAVTPQPTPRSNFSKTPVTIPSNKSPFRYSPNGYNLPQTSTLPSSSGYTKFHADIRNLPSETSRRPWSRGARKTDSFVANSPFQPSSSPLILGEVTFDDIPTANTGMSVRSFGNSTLSRPSTPSYLFASSTGKQSHIPPRHGQTPRLLSTALDNEHHVTFPPNLTGQYQIFSAPVESFQDNTRFPLLAPPYRNNIPFPYLPELQPSPVTNSMRMAEVSYAPSSALVPSEVLPVDLEAQLAPEMIVVEDSEGYNRTLSFFLSSLPSWIYLSFLFQLPSLYLGRVARIFEEADLSLPEIKEMAMETAVEGKFDLTTMENGALPPRYASLKVTWQSFIDDLMREWKTFNIISVLLLTAILTILQIDDVSADPVPRYSALFSLMCALISLLFGCMYIIRFGSMRKTNKAAEWALEARKMKIYIFWNVWVLLAMPVIWLVWSNLLFLFCIMSYVWRADMSHIPKRLDGGASLAVRLALTLILALGIIYGILILWTFNRYGKAMDKAWKRRIDGWLEEKALQSSPEAMRIPHVDQESFPFTGGRDPGLLHPHYSSDSVGQQEYRPPSYVDIDYQSTSYDTKGTHGPIDPPIDSSSRRRYTYGNRSLSSRYGTPNLASGMDSGQLKPKWRSTAFSPPSLSTITDVPHTSTWQQSANSSAGSSRAHADGDTTQDSNRRFVTPLGSAEGSG